MLEISFNELVTKATDLVSQGGMYTALIIFGLVVLVLVSAKLFLRLAIFFLALLLIWVCFYAVGLAPCPYQYFSAPVETEEVVVKV